MERNIIWYIHEYGNQSFDQFPLNEVDALIFSQLAYNSYDSVLKKFSDEISFSNSYDTLIKNNKKSQGMSKDSGREVLYTMKNKQRYKNIIFKYYRYMIGEDYQFGAISIIIPNKYIYINFEGTDSTISGWKENFSFSYKYPTISQSLAGSYINEVLNNCKLPCIITGHSKGGNLALAGVMNTSTFKLRKIIKIYSFDGPGLRNQEFYSLKYKLIRNKLINIIPEQSLFGVLLNQENTVIIRSYAVGIMQHSALNWKIDKDSFLRGKQSNLSVNLSIAIENWLNKYSELQKEEITKYLFSLFESNGIKSLSELKRNKLKIINIIKSSITMSKETKLVLFNCFQVLMGEINLQIIENSEKNFFSMIEKIKRDLITL